MNANRTALYKVRLMTLSAFFIAALSSGCASTPRLEDYCAALSQGVAEQIDSDKDAKAKKYWVYAVLSNNVYKPAGHPEIWIDANEWQAVCDRDAQTTNSYNLPDCQADNPGKGLEAKTYLRWSHGINNAQPTELVFVFRGTTSISDWWCGNIWDCQYGEADDYVMKAINKYRAIYPAIAIVATGHSLGGGLAQHVAFCVEGVQAVAFNTSPRSHKRECSRDLTPAQKQDIEKNHIIRIHQHNEILSSIRHVFSSSNYSDTVYNFAAGSPVSRHGMTSLAMGLTKLAACPIQKGLNGFSAPGQPGAEAVPTKTCASKSVEFYCAPPN